VVTTAFLAGIGEAGRQAVSVAARVNRRLFENAYAWVSMIMPFVAHGDDVSVSIAEKLLASPSTIRDPRRIRAMLARAAVTLHRVGL